MLLRGLIRPKASWPFGLFRAPRALVLHAAPSLEQDRHSQTAGFEPAPGDPETADRFYCGRFVFAGETVAALPELLFTLPHPSASWRQERDDLGWLRHFTVRPRRLHVYFLARLLSSWLAASRPSRDIAAESRKLDHIANATFRLGDLAGTKEQDIFHDALQLQCARLLHLKAVNADEAVLQSLSLLEVASRDDRFAGFQDKAWKQLSVNLSQLVLEDGSEASREVDRAIVLAGRITRFLTEKPPASVPATVMSACDRLLAYVAMFRLGPGLWSSAVSVVVPAELETMISEGHPPGQAVHGGRSLLQQGETRILAHWGGDFHEACLEIAHRGKPVIYIGHGVEGPIMQAQAADHQAEAGAGEVVNMRWSGREGTREKSVYLSANGTDIRFEEYWLGMEECSTIIVKLPEQARILTTHDATQAGIVLADDSCWQIKVRGAKVAKAGRGLALHFTSAREHAEPTCWALRRLPPKARGGRSQRRQVAESELPF